MQTKSQDIQLKCYLCHNSSKNVLCEKCSKNPFLVEDARNKASKENNLQMFGEFYKDLYSEIKNINTNNFWNNEFENELTLNDQDSMTKDKINKIFQLVPKKKINMLDLGFGQGYLEEKLLANNSLANVTGVDISSVATKRARSKFKGRYISGDILKVKKIVNSTKFDIVLTIEVIEHISPKDIIQFFKDVRSLLKPNGILIISTPLNEHLRVLKINPSNHVRDYTISIVKTELEISGFKTLEYKTLYAFRRWYWLKNTLAKAFPKRWEPNNVIFVARKN